MVKRDLALSNCHNSRLWYVALQQNWLKGKTMSALLGVITVIYGASMLVAAGGGLLYAVSPDFRRSLKGDTPAI
jgi:hypothetical protein